MDNLNNIPNAGNWGDAASKLNDNFNKVKQAVTTVENVSKNNKGYFTSLSALNTAFPSPKAGLTAYVYDEASSTKYYIYNAVNGAWVSSSVEAPSVVVDISEYTKTGGSTKTTKEVEDDLANLSDYSLNSGKSYPFINQPNPKTAGINAMNDLILDVSVLELSHLVGNEFSIALVARNATAGNWGNAIHVKVLNSETLEETTSFEWRSTNTDLDADTINQLSKLEKGGIQTISLFNSAYNRSFIITLNTDAISDGQIIDAGYTTSNKMYFSGDVYKKTPVTTLANTPVFNALSNKVNNIDDTLTNLSDYNLNAGKSYPFINQPNLSIINTVNSIFIDAQIQEEQHNDAFEYTVSLVARNAITGNWGNAIVINRLNKSDLTDNTSYGISSTNINTSEEDLKQLAKLQIGGIQTISFYNAVWNKRFIITLDTDAINDGQMIDISYSTYKDSNKMYFSGAVYNKVSRIKYTDLVTKTDLADLSDYNLNDSKSYPFINQPNLSIINTINRIFIDTQIQEEQHDNASVYSVSLIAKNNTTGGMWGNAIVIRKLKKPDLTSYGSYGISSTNANTSEEDKLQLAKLQFGGIQTISFYNAVWNKRFIITLNTDAINDGQMIDISYTNQDRNKMYFSGAVYNKVSGIKPYAPTTSIFEFNTFREALEAEHKGLIKVGAYLATSKVEDVVFSGSKELYKPSAVYSQYTTLNMNSIIPKRKSQIINFEDLDGYATRIKSFGKRYIYFGNAFSIYRTQDELKFDLITHENTFFEKLILSNPLPDSYRPNDIQNCYELDNGEILIEVRNGVKEDPETDYQGHRVQLYLTENFKNAPRQLVNGILEINLEGLLSKVHEYKAYTRTTGKTGTTISIENNKIAISPYYIGLVGLVHYSNDFGKTWKVIFNMGVEDETFAVPYKGSTGAWPLPENLNPVMPANMWTEGGNTNYHTHGVCIDPYLDGRIWVCTGDAGQNYQGRTALWYTDDEGESWVRMQTTGPSVLDSYAGLQPMGVVCLKNCVLVGSDSPTDGFYRWNRNSKTAVPQLEPAWWHNDEYSTALKVIYGGSAITDEGFVYSLFHPNTSTHYDAGVVNFTSDGILFEDVYKDEISDEAGILNISWGSWIGRDRHNNIYIANSNGTIIKLF